jgi:hypothetical protein
MFGPKNAPTTQMQYLFLTDSKDRQFSEPTDSENGLANLRKANPVYGFVLTVTQFEGIPLSDCFRVVQYWTFGRDRDPRTGIIKIGLFIPFLKHTIFKSQIESAVKEELTHVATQWIAFAEKRMVARVGSFDIDEDHRHSLSSTASSYEMELAEQTVSSNPNSRRNSRPSNITEQWLGDEDDTRRHSILQKLEDDLIAKLNAEEIGHNKYKLREHIFIAIVIVLLVTIIIQWLNNSSLKSSLQRIDYKMDAIETKLNLQLQYLERNSV